LGSVVPIAVSFSVRGLSRHMATLTAYIDGLGMLGPGINTWAEGRTILRDEMAIVPQKTVYPAVAALPPAERRRSSAVVKLAITIGTEAAEQAGVSPQDLPAVFASSGGDNYNCHAICEQLATDDKFISPTRFHNSVTNAPAGYWGIATGAMTSSTVICAHDASFGAGLLESAAQVVSENSGCILIAYDTDYPEPLHSVRPIPDGFGVALVLSPQRTPRSMAAIQVSLCQDDADPMEDDKLEALRVSIPAARSLPMIRYLARDEGGRVVLDYLDTSRIAVEITPCG
jgi:hypothetical protein